MKRTIMAVQSYNYVNSMHIETRRGGHVGDISTVGLILELVGEWDSDCLFPSSKVNKGGSLR